MICTFKVFNMPTVFGQTFCIPSRKTALAPAYTRSFVLRCSIQFMRLFVRYHELVDPTRNVVTSIISVARVSRKIFKFYFNHQILNWSDSSFLISIIGKTFKTYSFIIRIHFSLKIYKNFFKIESAIFNISTKFERVTIFPKAWPRNENNSDLSISVRFRRNWRLSSSRGRTFETLSFASRDRSNSAPFHFRTCSFFGVGCRTGVIGRRLSSVTRVIVDSSRATG